MDWFEAIILGLIQGLTEFLPVSSSGHLELGKALLGAHFTDDLLFTVVVHGATVLSTLIVFRKDILELIAGLLKFRWNKETKYVAMIILSMVPVGFVGVFLKDHLTSLLESEYIVLFVGFMLLVTATLLSFTYYAKRKGEDISFGKAFVVGVAQAVAVLPGISRSGTTIAVGLLLGLKKEKIAKFSFLMVIAPILGENILAIASYDFSSAESVSVLPVFIAGFLAAFVSGLFACSLMLKVVKNGKLIYFAIYCILIGIVSISSWLFLNL